MANRFCTACGAPLEEGAERCNNCGTAVKAADMQPQQAAQSGSWADFKQVAGQPSSEPHLQPQPSAAQSQPMTAQPLSQATMGQTFSASAQPVQTPGPNKKLIIGIGAGAIAIILVILFVTLGSSGTKGGDVAMTAAPPANSSAAVSGPPVFTSVQVSSQLPGDDDTADYGAVNLTDGIVETAWNEGASGDGTGERITLSASTPQHVTSVSIMGGFPKYYKDGSDVYFKNNRPHSITISYDSGFQSFDMQDLRGQFQTFTLAQPVDTKQLIITIDSVYKGTKYDECCIAEVKVQ